MDKSNPHSLDLNLLTIFVMLWDSRSVSRTSQLLSITQPAVSHALKRLRTRLGDPLFVVGRQGLVPTAKAEQLIVPVREALLRIQAAIEQTEEFRPLTSKRTFRIAMLDLVEYWVLPALLEFTMSEAPLILIRGVHVPDAGSAQALLESGGVDFVLTDREPASKAIRSERLYEERLSALIWHREGIESDQFPIDLFIERPHVVFQMRDPSVDEALARHGYSRRIGAIAQNFFTMPVVAAKTGYICSLPSRIANECAGIFGLSVHVPPIDIPAWPLYAAWHARYDADPAVKWLLSKLRKISSETEARSRL